MYFRGPDGRGGVTDLQGGWGNPGESADMRHRAYQHSAGRVGRARSTGETVRVGCRRRRLRRAHDGCGRGRWQREKRARHRDRCSTPKSHAVLAFAVLNRTQRTPARSPTPGRPRIREGRDNPPPTGEGSPALARLRGSRRSPRRHRDGQADARGGRRKVEVTGDEHGSGSAIDCALARWTQPAISLPLHMSADGLPIGLLRG